MLTFGVVVLGVTDRRRAEEFWSAALGYEVREGPFGGWARVLAPPDGTGPVIASERGGPMTPLSVVTWFANAYGPIGLDGCSSHSGRLTFITRAARLAHHAGGSLRDVQLLAGHRSIQTTQRYIDGDTDAQRKLVSLI